VSAEVQFYLVILLVYGCVALISCWGLDLQFGDTGILNFAFIVFQAVGAYTAALLTLGPVETGVFGKMQEYFWGADLPFPVPVLVAAGVGALLSVPIGFVALRRLRSDYQAVAMLAVSLIATTMMVASPGFVGGQLGLYAIPQPFEDSFALSSTEATWAYLGFCIACVAVVGWIVVRISRAPLGRTLRAIREHPDAAAALGINLTAVRMGAFVVGNALAALSGALLIQFIGAYSTNDWLFPETFILLAAVIIGGSGNKFGVMLGVLLLPVGLSEAVRYLPSIIRPGLIHQLQFIVLGMMILAFLWFRPTGLCPERRRRFDVDGRARPSLAFGGTWLGLQRGSLKRTRRPADASAEVL